MGDTSENNDKEKLKGTSEKLLETTDSSKIKDDHSESKLLVNINEIYNFPKKTNWLFFSRNLRKRMWI